MGRRFREDLILDAMQVVENEVGVLARNLPWGIWPIWSYVGGLLLLLLYLWTASQACHFFTEGRGLGRRQDHARRRLLACQPN